MSTVSIELWVGFTVLFFVMLGIDLFAGRHREGRIPLRQAALWTAVWVGTALLFNAFLWYLAGRERALEFLAGYLLEYSLSVDNLFVFIMVFSYFNVPPAAQIRALKWGIFGAILMRGLFIAVGAALLATFHWAIYVFGLFILFTGIKMVFHDESEEVHPDRNIFVRLARRMMPVSDRYDGDRFFTRDINGRRYMTPLFVVLLVIESTDVLFALDSIPAIYGITNDPFVVYSSNVFAIMGLRAVFFLLAGALTMFQYLKTGVALVLVFIGVKMTISGWLHIPIEVSLGAVFLILFVSVLASVLQARRDRKSDHGLRESQHEE